jgi:hypothetical protein
MKLLLILLLIIIIIIFYYYENFTDNKIVIPLKEYENYSLDNYFIYDNIFDLIDSNQNIKTDNNILIYLINYSSGFGSVLTVFIQNDYYLKELNSNIITLPCYNTNTFNFKYHEPSYNNSFFLYFKYKNKDIDLSKYKIYFAKSNVIDNYPFFNSVFPTLSSDINKNYINYFRSKFEYIVNTNVVNYITTIKYTTLIGIHIRSLAQKITHLQDYLNISIKDRLLNLKLKIDNNYSSYQIFIITDVSMYLNIAKEIFGTIYYLEDIARINTENDSIPELDNYTGYKLGSDILNECLCLSLCDKIYVSHSNIPYIISIMNPNIDMEEY